MPLTQRRVVPYLKECGPPAFVAMLPPICDCSAAPGSGREEQPVGTRETVQVCGAKAGLDLDPPEMRVELAYGGHSLERDDEPAVDRNCAAGQTGAAATGRHDHGVTRTPREQAGHLVGALGKGDGVGATAQAAPLCRVGQVLRGWRLDASCSEEPAQVGYEAHPDGLCTRAGHRASLATACANA
jgi:hypothetical protein